MFYFRCWYPLCWRTIFQNIRWLSMSEYRYNEGEICAIYEQYVRFLSPLSTSTLLQQCVTVRKYNLTHFNRNKNNSFKKAIKLGLFWGKKSIWAVILFCFIFFIYLNIFPGWYPKLGQVFFPLSRKKNSVILMKLLSLRLRFKNQYRFLYLHVPFTFFI